MTTITGKPYLSGHLNFPHDPRCSYRCSHPSPRVPERFILLIGRIQTSKGVFHLHSLGFHPFCVPLLIFPSAKGPPGTSRNDKQEPGDDGRDHSREVTRRVFPQLRRCDTSGAVTDEEHSIGNTAFGISFDVRGTQTEQHRPWRSDTRSLDLSVLPKDGP